MRGMWIGAAGLVLIAAALVAVREGPPIAPEDLPEMRALPGGVIDYRPSGSYRRGGQVVDPPPQRVEIAPGLEIMRLPVSQATYAACVADGACAPTRTTGAADLPQTHVNFHDAEALAGWLSARTGDLWRLPSGPEWAHAAAELYVEEAPSDATDDPAAGWLEAYRRNAAQRGDADPTLRPFGSYPENSLGVGHLGGNVWEWTTGCLETVDLDAPREAEADYCGVRLAQGLHRAFIIDFVRDASVGGCAVGLPPDHLAIRLVRERRQG